jgi:hypothetical protein
MRSDISGGGATNAQEDKWGANGGKINERRQLKVEGVGILTGPDGKSLSPDVLTSKGKIPEKMLSKDDIEELRAQPNYARLIDYSGENASMLEGVSKYEPPKPKPAPPPSPAATTPAAPPQPPPQGGIPPPPPPSTPTGGKSHLDLIKAGDFKLKKVNSQPAPKPQEKDVKNLTLEDILVRESKARAGAGVTLAVAAENANPKTELGQWLLKAVDVSLENLVLENNNANLGDEESQAYAEIVNMLIGMAESKGGNLERADLEGNGELMKLLNEYTPEGVTDNDLLDRLSEALGKPDGDGTSLAKAIFDGPAEEEW